MPGFHAKTSVRHLQGVTIKVGEYQRHRDFIYNNLKKFG